MSIGILIFIGFIVFGLIAGLIVSRIEVAMWESTDDDDDDELIHYTKKELP